MSVRWYLAYPLNYRHIEELMAERGVNVDHSMINRWVVYYSVLIPSLSSALGQGPDLISVLMEVSIALFMLHSLWKYRE